MTGFYEAKTQSERDTFPEMPSWAEMQQIAQEQTEIGQHTNPNMPLESQVLETSEESSSPESIARDMIRERLSSLEGLSSEVIRLGTADLRHFGTQLESKSSYNPETLTAIISENIKTESGHTLTRTVTIKGTQGPQVAPDQQEIEILVSSTDSELPYINIDLTPEESKVSVFINPTRFASMDRPTLPLLIISDKFFSGGCSPLVLEELARRRGESIEETLIFTPSTEDGQSVKGILSLDKSVIRRRSQISEGETPPTKFIEGVPDSFTLSEVDRLSSLPLISEHEIRLLANYEDLKQVAPKEEERKRLIEEIKDRIYSRISAVLSIEMHRKGFTVERISPILDSVLIKIPKQNGWKGLVPSSSLEIKKGGIDPAEMITSRPFLYTGEIIRGEELSPPIQGREILITPTCICIKVDNNRSDNTGPNMLLAEINMCNDPNHPENHNKAVRVLHTEFVQTQELSDPGKRAASYLGLSEGQIRAKMRHLGISPTDRVAVTITGSFVDGQHSDSPLSSIREISTVPIHWGIFTQIWVRACLTPVNRKLLSLLLYNNGSRISQLAVHELKDRESGTRGIQRRDHLGLLLQEKDASTGKVTDQALQHFDRIIDVLEGRLYIRVISGREQDVSFILPIIRVELGLQTSRIYRRDEAHIFVNLRLLNRDGENNAAYIKRFATNPSEIKSIIESADLSQNDPRRLLPGEPVKEEITYH